MTTEFIPAKDFMYKAARLAEKAEKMGEIPVGAVVELGGKIIGTGYNTRETQKNPLGHAELMAIAMAAKALGDWRLTGANLYVTLEPCPMCTGAIINARINRVIFGAADLQAGCCGSTLNLCAESRGHKPKIYKGFMESECTKQLKDFFKALREDK